MIASLRGLVVLAVIAVGLLVALIVVESPARPAAGDRTLLSSLPPRVVQVVFRQGKDDRIMLNLEADQWVNATSDRFVADPDVVRSVIDAARGARWHRRAPAAAAGTIDRYVHLVGEGNTESRVIGIGAEVPGSEQTWVVVDGAAYLVDTWVTRALWPGAERLRQRMPLAAIADGPYAITVGELTLERYRMLKPHTLRVDPALRDALVAALAALEYVSFDGQVDGEPQLLIKIATAPRETFLRNAGTCAGGRLRIYSTSGHGCVEPAAWQRIVDAAAALQRPPAEVVDKRPLPFSPTKLVLADGAELLLTGRPRINDTDDVDPERLGELLAALAAPATPATLPMTVKPGFTFPETKPIGSIVAGDPDGGEVTLDILAGGLIARRGEPVALRPTRDAFAIITRPSSALRDPVLWRDDPLTISSIKLNSVTYTRGAVIGEWTRTPAGGGSADAVDVALVDALAQSLATVRAPSGPAPTGAQQRVTVTFTPPTGKPSTHTLAVGAPAANGCAARVDGANVRLDLALCTAVHALAAASN